jgi:hypothetical protein
MASHNASCVITLRVNKSAYHLQPSINCGSSATATYNIVINSLSASLSILFQLIKTVIIVYNLRDYVETASISCIFSFTTQLRVCRLPISTELNHT